jgi:heat shock protein HslJ
MKQTHQSVNKVAKMLFVAFLFVVTAACNSTKVAGFVVGPELSGTYQLTQIGEQNHSIDSIKMTIDGAKNRLSGNSGCNDFFAQYAIDGQNIAISSLGQTKMICADNAMAVEGLLFQLLSTSMIWESNKDTLILNSTAQGQGIIAIKIAN